MTAASAGEPSGGLPARALWRNRDFVLLWSGQAVSTLGTQVSTLALPLLVLAITGSPAQAGLITAAQSLPYLVLSLPAGALVDRWNRKAVMIRCDVIRCLVLGSIPVAYWLGHVSTVQLYLAAVVQGTAFVFFNIAEIAALPRVVPEAEVSRANAFNASADAAALVLGPGLSGFIISLARQMASGAVLAYLVDSVSYLASVISLGFIRTPFQAARLPVTGRSLSAEIGAGLRFLWGHRRIRTLAILDMVSNFLFSPLYLIVIVLARNTLHADTRTIGLIFSLSSSGAVVGALVAPWLKSRLRFGHIVIGAVVVQALAVPLAAAAVSPLMVIAGGVIAFITVPIFNVTQISYRLTLIPDELQGRVNSVFRLLSFGGQPLGSAIGGLLLAPLGPRVLLWAIAAGLGLTAIAVSCTDIRNA